MAILDINSASPIALNSNSTLFECRDDAGEYNSIHKTCNVIISSALLVLGTGGNLATYNVFKQRAYRHNVVAGMFRYLSVLDLIFLWTTVLQLLVKGLTGYHVSNTISRACLLYAVVSQVLMSLSNCLLVVISLARLVHIKCPLKSQTICSKLNYNLLLVATHLLVIGVHGGSTLIMHVRLTEEDYNSGDTCYYHITREEIQSKLQNLLYLTVNFLGPAFLLTILNSMVILELLAVQSRRQRLFTKTPTSSKYIHGPSTEVSNWVTTEQDISLNALWSDEPLEVPLKVAKAIPQQTKLPTTMLPDHNDILDDYNWNRPDVPAPGVQLTPGEPYTARSNTSRLTVENSHQYLGASLAVGSEVTSQSSRSQPVSSGRRLSIRTWISDLRSNGVDMDCEEDLNLGQNDPGITAPATEQAIAVPQSGKTIMRQDSRTYTLTLMLVAANVVFLLLNTPFWIVRLGFVKSFTHPSVGCSLRYMLTDILLFVRYSNNSVNFIFYCVIGKRFRHDFVIWFKNLCR